MQSLATAQMPVVGVLSGLQINGGFDMRSQQVTPPWMVLEDIRQQFHIESLKRDIDMIPTNVSVLMLVHPKDLPEQTLYAVDQFVMRGGKLLVFVDPFSGQYLDGVEIDYVTTMMGSGFTFKNPNASGGCGCGTPFTWSSPPRMCSVSPGGTSTLIGWPS